VNDHHAALIADKGQLFEQQVHMRPGVPNCCHINAAELWAAQVNKYKLVNGYALGGDEWVSHSWVVEGNNLYETTHKFDRYFGVALNPLMAFAFWTNNVHNRFFPDGDAPDDFWKKHLWILAMAMALDALPRETYDNFIKDCPGIRSA
jgi:hypothetical protein